MGLDEFLYYLVVLERIPGAFARVFRYLRVKVVATFISIYFALDVPSDETTGVWGKQCFIQELIYQEKMQKYSGVRKHTEIGCTKLKMML